jgi:hypothetical protein
VVAAHSGTFYGQSMTAGGIYTVAGDGSSGYAATGDLLISDTGSSRIREVAG